MNEVLSIALTVAVVNNLALDRYLTPHADLRGVGDTLVIAAATAGTLLAAVAATYTLHRFVLEPLAALRFELLALLLASAAAARLVAASVPTKHAHASALLREHAPLVAGSGALLGIVVQRAAGGSLLLHVATSLAAGLAFAVVLAMLAGLRRRLARTDVPAPFRGAAIVLVMAAFLALAFAGITGTAQL